MNAETMTGQISTYVPDRGWGLISSAVAQPLGHTDVHKYWFHISQYRSKDIKPALGVAVSFSVSPVKDGRCETALDVTPI